MPELPEVEVTRRGLLPHVAGKQVVNIWWSGKKLRTDIDLAAMQQGLSGNTITSVDRRAKYLLFRIETGATFIIHLGMTGKLSYLSEKEAKQKHDHLAILLADGSEIRFNDSRRFGSVLFWPEHIAAEKELLFDEKEGIEPLSSQFNGKTLHQLAQNRSVAVKTFLMNSRIIAGIGNIYMPMKYYSGQRFAQHVPRKLLRCRNGRE